MTNKLLLSRKLLFHSLEGVSPPLPPESDYEATKRERLKVLHELDQLCQSEKLAIEDVPIIEDNEKYDETSTKLHDVIANAVSAV